MTITAGTKCFMASFNHLFLLSAERCFAIKHLFAYENLITEVRIIIASGLAWAAAIVLLMENATMTFCDKVSSVYYSARDSLYPCNDLN